MEKEYWIWPNPPMNPLFLVIYDENRREYLNYKIWEWWYLSLNDFWIENLSKDEWEKIKNNELKQLDLTLKYLYPLLRDWKLKVRINKYKKEYWSKEDYKDGFIYSFYKWKEYKKEEAKKAIRDIRKKWLSIKNKRERKSFENSGVEFILPEKNNIKKFLK